jgi:uncharacterized protein (TIGR02996 family)
MNFKMFMTETTDLGAFVDTVLQGFPTNKNEQLIFADYLEEHGEPELAELIRWVRELYFKPYDPEVSNRLKELYKRIESRNFGIYAPRYVMFSMTATDKPGVNISGLRAREYIYSEEHRSWWKVQKIIATQIPNDQVPTEAKMSVLFRRFFEMASDLVA